MDYFRNLTVIFLLLLKCLRAKEYFEKVEAVVGQSVELPCNTTAENEHDKLNILAWYRNGSATAFYSRDLRGGNQNETPTEGQYRLVLLESADEVILEIVTVSPADAGVYICLADFAASPALKTHIELVIIEPPHFLWVTTENGTEVAKASAEVNTSQNIGPYYVGDTVHLACIAYGGQPLASISWWTEQRILKKSSKLLSEQRVLNELVYGPLLREDHGRVFTCYAKNNEKTTPLSIDIILDMYLPPDLVSLRSEGPGSYGSMARVNAGEALSLKCRVIGARPLPPITWRLNDQQLPNLKQKITMEPSQRLVMSEIKLTINRHFDESLITCCAPAHRYNNQAFICSQALPLNVLYSPVLEIVAENDVDNNTLAIVKGSNVSLGCNYEANPPISELGWIHNKEEGITNELNDNKDAIQSILELKNVSDDDAGEYLCFASNEQGFKYSNSIFVDITYPAYCEEENIVEYGLRENEVINISCHVKANPEPTSYLWVFVNDAVNETTMKNHPQKVLNTDEPVLSFIRPNDTAFSTIFCWGQNNVSSASLPHTPCIFLVTDETIPRPPTKCEAKKKPVNDQSKNNIVVTCEKGHDGGLVQKFKLFVQSESTEEPLTSIINLEPKFMIEEPPDEDYKLLIIAFNDKGESQVVEIDVDGTVVASTVSNITSLALALCGGVALVVLAACGLALCTHERAAPPRAPRSPLCAYTDESNCETFPDSDGSECNVRRTESFRRAVSRHPSKNFDVRRTSSFHSARYMNEMTEQDNYKTNDSSRRANCRVHSLQNINRKRDMDALCDHLVLRLPETDYNVPRAMNTFYTMPRKIRHKLAKELSDEASEITQTSDGFSLPPPPDEFGTYRAGTKIKDMPTKSTPTYTTILRKNSTGRDPTKQHHNNVTTSPNIVGLPTVSHTGIYSYPDDDQVHQVNTNPFDEDSS